MGSPLEGLYDLNPAKPDIHQGAGTFGAARRSRNNVMTHHAGIDIKAPIGTPVHAAEPGRVVRADGTDHKGYGNQVLVLHPDGRMTRYAHLREFGVKVGDQVQQGQSLGATGVSGNPSTQKGSDPHLHYEVIVHGKPVNPDFYSDRPERGGLDPRTWDRVFGDG